MLPKKVIEGLKAMGIDADALINAVKDEKEVDFNLPAGAFYTEQDLTTRDANKVKEGEKLGKTQGEKDAMEAAKRELQKVGLEVKGDRWGDIVKEVEGFSKASEADVVKQLREQNRLLAEDNTKFKNEAETALKASQQAAFDLEVIPMLPAHALGIKPRESLELLRMRGYTPEKTENGIAWKKGDKYLTDTTTHAPLVGETAVSKIWESEGFASAGAGGQGGNGGRGGGNGGGAGGVIRTLSEARKAYTAANNGNENYMSDGFQKYVNEVSAKVENFDFLN